MKNLTLLVLVAVAVTFSSGNAVAEGSGVRLEAHGGIGLPTFDIGDAAKVGPLGGAGIWYKPVDQKWTVGAEADFGFHPGADIDISGVTVEGPDVNVFHVMGKAGYYVYTSADSKLNMVLNAGAGVVMFDVDVEGAESKSYPAINAGYKLYYALSEKVDFALSLQGDIAFSKQEELGTDNAWVWPLAVGIAIKL